ncbi:MAG: hypothetical protein WC928_03330 [Patescibacteria group bacterium]|jgi:hypothetical protein
MIRFFSKFGIKFIPGFYFRSPLDLISSDVDSLSRPINSNNIKKQIRPINSDNIKKQINFSKKSNMNRLTAK